MKVLWITIGCFAVVLGGAVLGLLGWRYAEVAQRSRSAAWLRRLFLAVLLLLVVVAVLLVGPSSFVLLVTLLFVAFFFAILRGGWRAAGDGRLNGWQRLWRGVMVLWLAVMVALTVFSGSGWFPRRSAIESMRVEDSLLAVGRYLEASGPGYPHRSNPELRRARYADLGDAQLIERLHAEFAGQVDFSGIEARYRRDLATMRPKQARALATTLIAWALQGGFLLALENMAAWLRRRRDQLQAERGDGFRSPP